MVKRRLTLLMCVVLQSWTSQQQRPSVLRQVFPTPSRQQRCASLQQQSAGLCLQLQEGVWCSCRRHRVFAGGCWTLQGFLLSPRPENGSVVSVCKDEPDVSCLLLQSSSPQMGSSSWESHHHICPPRRDSPAQPSTEDRREG